MTTFSLGVTDADLTVTAESFIAARRSGAALEDYPGTRPATLDLAYRIQDAAIDRWRSALAGWKVGRIVGAAADALGVDRLAGPIFTDRRWFLESAPLTVGVFNRGFAAVEGEIIAILNSDAPPSKLHWTREEALAIIGALHAGAEIASSPYARINSDGPLVTISDFGNNNGLIIGDEIPAWDALRFDDWRCRVIIDGAVAGANDASSIPGGPIESLRFVLENAARRGRPMKKGMAVCTGAITGVHEIAIGQAASVEFAGLSDIKFTVADAALAHSLSAAE